MNSINIKSINSKNFGDAVNKIFWEKITNKKITNNTEKIHYITTGSIMCLVNNNSIIYGTGFISKLGDLGGGKFKSKSNKIIKKPHSIISVRGPRTRDKLLKFNIVCPKIYGDPLILFPCIYNKKSLDLHSLLKQKITVGIIPHYIDQNNVNINNLKKSLNNKGYIIRMINILTGDNYEPFIDKINECDYIISSSLHGVIMGLVYKKKTIFIEFSNKVIGNKFKFNDFFESIGIKYTNKNTYNINVLTNFILIDYDKLVNTGVTLIDICPFINQQRKNELIKKYKEFYSN